MPSVLQVEPDPSFTRSVIAAGASDLKKCCLECGVCTVACELAPEDAPFPRQQMIEAQWGLRERAVADPGIWLCHDCGECTAQCPKGARPGDVLAALRHEAIKAFAFPRFMGGLVAQRWGLLPLLALPVIVFAAIAKWAPRGAPTPHLEFANVFPIPTLEALFFTVAGVVVVAFGISLRRMIVAWRATGRNGAVIPGLVPALRAVVTHERFALCRRGRGAYLGHFLTFWGFIGLALTGTAVGIGTMAHVMRTPLDLTSPWKILANLSAAVVLVGCLMLLIDRIKGPAQRAASTYFDWFFLLMLTGVVLTGISSELLRLAQAANVMYAVYFVHLALILSLFLYAPYSKFAHFAYRTVAMAAAIEGKSVSEVQVRRQAA
jgi:quinone-modifying oxidoreductase subunit QmoC